MRCLLRWATSTFKRSSCNCMLFMWADIRSRVRLNRSCPASAAKIDSQLAVSSELLGGVGGSKLTMMRACRSGVGGSKLTTMRVLCSDIAADNRVGTSGGNHTDGKEQT